MTFIDKAKRFFEPCFDNKIVLCKWLFVSFLWWINSIIHLLFLERIMYYLLNDPTLFGRILLMYSFYLVVYESINFSVRKWWWVELLWNSWQYISRKYLTRFVGMDNTSIEVLWTGKLISIINLWVEKWGLLIWDTIEHLIALFIAICFTIYMITKINSVYPVLFIWLLVTFFLISYAINKKIIPYRILRNENYINTTKQVVKIVMSKNEILQNNMIGFQNKIIDELYRKDIEINKNMGTLRAILTRNSGIWMSIIIILSYYFLWFWFLSWNIELSILIWLSGTLIIIQKVIYENLTFYIDFTKEFVKVSKLWDFYDTVPEIRWYESWNSFLSWKKDIEIQNISYGYNETKVFQDFSLTIEQGKKTALVGASGGGKTTLLKLIAGYLHPDKGSISVLGNILSETALKSYYPHIGYLTQDPSVFDATIRENLVSSISSFGAEFIEQALEQKLIEALHLAHCDFVFEMQQWLDTEIGERWVRLSWGQKQRLAIAKIFLKNPDIILLDEPTSALDSFSEEAITQALNTLFQWRTVIIIAHRLQTVRHADDIVVIEGGEVVERWNHDTLSTTGWIYARMLELQSGF